MLLGVLSRTDGNLLAFVSYEKENQLGGDYHGYQRYGIGGGIGICHIVSPGYVDQCASAGVEVMPPVMEPRMFNKLSFMILLAMRKPLTMGRSVMIIPYKK